MPARDCGCWEGAWLGVDPPPMCERHARWQAPVDIDPIADINRAIAELERFRNTRPPRQTLFSVDDCIAMLGQSLHAAINEADSRGDIAGADAWRIAAQAVDVALTEVWRAQGRQS